MTRLGQKSPLTLLSTDLSFREGLNNRAETLAKQAVLIDLRQILEKGTWLGGNGALTVWSA